MDDPSNSTTPLTMEEGIRILMRNAKQRICNRYRKCEDRIRASPNTAVMGAVAAGYILHRLPVREILVTQVRIISSLTPPVLLLLGAAKLYDFLQQQEIVKKE